jgi:hypothetical protein
MVGWIIIRRRTFDGFDGFENFCVLPSILIVYEQKHTVLRKVYMK